MLIAFCLNGFKEPRHCVISLTWHKEVVFIDFVIQHVILRCELEDVLKIIWNEFSSTIYWNIPVEMVYNFSSSEFIAGIIFNHSINPEDT